MTHGTSVALMKFLSGVATRLGVSQHVYIVGGAVRNWVMDPSGQKYPIKDLDVVIDSKALNGKDSEWFARQLIKAIPAETSLATNNYGVAILTVSGSWIVGGEDLKGEVIEIANARKESYGKGGYKPEFVEPATIEEDTARRELTFNSLLWRLHDLASGPDKAEILDLTGCGLQDLREGIMRCPSDPDQTFKDDPSRMIRVLKFLIKYGFRISPEVESAIFRNKERVRNIPSGHLSNMIISLFYETGVGKRALLEMDNLGLLDEVKSIVQTDKPFREALGNWAEKHADIDFLFDLMDLGMPVGKALSFLNPADKARVREISVGMSHDEADVFIDILNQPGKVIDMPLLIEEFGLKGAEIRTLMLVSRELLLSNPALAGAPVRWENQIRERMGSFSKQAVRVAADYGIIKSVAAAYLGED